MRLGVLRRDRFRLRGNRKWKQIQWTGGGAQFVGGDSQISRCGRKAAMAEQQLDRAHVGSPFKEVDRKGVPQ